MMKLMMVNQDQASKIGSSVTKNPPTWIIIHVENQKLRELPTMIATGMAKIAKTNSFITTDNIAPKMPILKIGLLIGATISGQN